MLKSANAKHASRPLIISFIEKFSFCAGFVHAVFVHLLNQVFCKFLCAGIVHAVFVHQKMEFIHFTWLHGHFVPKKLASPFHLVGRFISQVLALSTRCLYTNFCVFITPMEHYLSLPTLTGIEPSDLYWGDVTERSIPGCFGSLRRGIRFRMYLYHVDPIGNWIGPFGARPYRVSSFPPKQVCALIPQRDRAWYLLVCSLMYDVCLFYLWHLSQAVLN